MRSIKRITVFLLAAVMTVGMCMTAFAAPAGVSEGEEKLLNEAVAHAKALGIDTDASAAFKSASVSYTHLDVYKRQISADRFCDIPVCLSDFVGISLFL